MFGTKNKKSARDIIDDFAVEVAKMVDGLTESEASLQGIAELIGARYPYMTERVVAEVGRRRSVAEGLKNGTVEGDITFTGPDAASNTGRTMNEAWPTCSGVSDLERQRKGQ